MVKQILPKLREKKNISQSALAEALGVSRQAVAKWELGQSLPDIDKLVALADYFSISLDRLVRSDNDCSSSINVQDGGIDQELVQFLLRAKRETYAAGRGQVASSRPASHDLRYEEGDLVYIDTYLGNPKFGGQEALWRGGAPLWCMNYIGRVLNDQFSGDFLKQALLNVPNDQPFRGPSIWRSGEYAYHCIVTGVLEWFSGYEEIFCGDIKTYECFFHGGLTED